MTSDYTDRPLSHALLEDDPRLGDLQKGQDLPLIFANAVADVVEDAAQRLAERRGSVLDRHPMPFTRKALDHYLSIPPSVEAKRAEQLKESLIHESWEPRHAHPPWSPSIARTNGDDDAEEDTEQPRTRRPRGL